MSLVFQKLQINENTVDVPKNLLYLQEEFKQYTVA